MLDRRLIINFDWATLITAVFISAAGVVNIYSSTYPHSGTGTPLFLKQVYWLFMGFGLLAFTLSFDYRTYVRYAYPFYMICLLVLALVMIIGRTTSGSQRWLQLGIISFQPSELTKIALILGLTRFFIEKENLQGYGLRDLGIPFLMVGIPTFLIFRQPDLGSFVVNDKYLLRHSRLSHAGYCRAFSPASGG